MNTSTNYPNIAFIGAGNMACSIIKGLIDHHWPKDCIYASTKSKASAIKVKEKTGIEVTTDNKKIIPNAHIILLCVKPQMMKNVILELAPLLQSSNPLIISVAAGIKINSLQTWIGNNQITIVRSMPNTPSIIQCGVTGLIANDQLSSEQKTNVERIFNSIGSFIWLKKESELNAIISVSGSAPAYYFLFMEAMIDCAIKQGLDPETAKDLTIKTALGASQMATKLNINVKELRNQVTSPKGTTESAINQFEQGNLRLLVEKAMISAQKRAEELEEEFNN